MPTQAEKAEQFRALHQRPGAFIIPNPWDIGTARILASMGFAALATTSLGVANTLGQPTATMTEILDNARAIAAATDLPVTGDLENGGADDPRLAAETIRLAYEAGLVGGSIEDATGDPQRPIYDVQLAIERVHAAVGVARSLPVPFTLTARADNLIHGVPDIDDTIRRLQAFEAAGADVLYAPGLRDAAMIRTVTSALTRPLNVVMSHADPGLSMADVAAAGAKRISIGGSLSRYAMGAVIEAAREMQEGGTFGFISRAPSSRSVQAAFQPPN